MDSNGYILVTGATSGIGKEVAIQLSQNYPIIFHGRSEEKLNDVHSLLNSSKEHLPFEYDLENVDDLDNSLSEFLLNKGVTIKGFVHCAGFMSLVPAKMNSITSIDKTFKINLFSATQIIKTLMKRKVNKSALETIVFISSNISNFGAKAFSVYASSKGAVDSFMRSLALELAPTIRVNSVLPGALPTEMTKDIFKDDERTAEIYKDYPLGAGSVTDIANVVEFLISNKARWITGQQITVDGGKTIDVSS